MVSPGYRATSASSSDRYVEPHMKRHQHQFPSSSSPYKPGSGPRYPTPSTRRAYSSDSRDPAPEQQHSMHEQSGEHVCDYDSSPTQLYELLESSSWERARSWCRSHPEEARTWIVRKDKSHMTRWKLLPLHAAIIFQSPNFLVSALLEQYPGATARQDDQGMLPLHLAFRHKHDDEDLLELLLVQYPKAVVQKDRRDRVPLEHGRDSKFSAKLMRLYADAVTAATRVMSGKHGAHTSNNIFASPGDMTAGDRDRLEQDHKNEIKALTLKYENQIRKLKNISGEQIQSLEGDTEYRISMLQADYEKQITQLREAHTQKIADLQETNHIHIRRIEQTSADARQALEDRHKRELQELRDMLNNQIGRDKELSDALEKEIAHLQVALQERKGETELAALQATKLLDENEKLQELMAAVHEQQSYFQELLSEQQQDLEESRSIRQQVADALMRANKEEKARGHGTRMLDLTESLRRKIDIAMAEIKIRDQAQAQKQRLESHHLPLHPPHHQHHRHKMTTPKTRPSPRAATIPPSPKLQQEARVSGESRLERDRWETSRSPGTDKIDEKRSASVRGSKAGAMMDPPPIHPKAQARSDEEEKRSLLSRRREQIAEKREGSDNRKFGEVRVVADEISAITTYSDF